ncbi:MAG: heavy-metal-associated domain-containing protein [Spirochaetota bacterium]|nr:heavy-metal-associated domain-containing protein [Spirochaetota bacterium]
MTKALKSLGAVSEVTVSLETGEAVVSYDASDSILNDIKDAVTVAGYRVME